MKKTRAYIQCFMLFTLFLSAAFAAAQEEGPGSEIVSCANGQIKIEAKDIRPEDLMKEIGDKCGIKVLVVGEAYTDTPVSLKVQSMPVRKGVERVLRGINVPNFMMHFSSPDNGSRIVELDLVGKKGGEKYLSAGTLRTSTTTTVFQEPPKAEPRREEKKAVKDQITKEDSAKMQENFMKVMDEVLKVQTENDEEPDPAQILKLFRESVPQEMKDQIPAEVMEELERLEANTPQKK